MGSTAWPRWDGFRLERAQRCRLAHSTGPMLPSSTRKHGESDDHAGSCSARALASLRMHGWIPMVVDGPSPLEKNVPLPDFIRLPRLRLGSRALGRFGARSFRRYRQLPFAAERRTRAALVLCPCLSASVLFRRSSPLPISQCRGAPEHVGLNQHGRGGRGCAFGFGCLPSTPMSPAHLMRIGFDSAPLFWARPP